MCADLISIKYAAPDRKAAIFQIAAISIITVGVRGKTCIPLAWHSEAQVFLIAVLVRSIPGANMPSEKCSLARSIIASSFARAIATDTEPRLLPLPAAAFGVIGAEGLLRSGRKLETLVNSLLLEAGTIQLSSPSISLGTHKAGPMRCATRG